MKNFSKYIMESSNSTQIVKLLITLKMFKLHSGSIGGFVFTNYIMDTYCPNKYNYIKKDFNV